jgi:hypothetical protein
LVGILHHVKSATPAIVGRLSKVAPKVVVMEPNGNHPGRKAAEFLPSYRAAGEQSFRTKELLRIFEANGYQQVFYRRFSIFPNVTPTWFYKLGLPFEPAIERSWLNRLCINQVFGFELKTPAAR